METKQGYFDPTMPRPLDLRHYKATQAEILTIPEGARYIGLEIYAYTEDEWYQFQGGVTDGDLKLSTRPADVKGPTYWYVDVNNGQAANTGSEGNPFDAIQKGVDSASDGDVIYVATGTYVEAVTIAKSVTIIGSDRSSTYIDGGITTSGNTVTLRHISMDTLTRTSGLVEALDCYFYSTVSGASMQLNACGFDDNITGFAGSLLNCQVSGTTTLTGGTKVISCTLVTLVCDSAIDVTVTGTEITTLTHNTGTVNILACGIGTVDGTLANPTLLSEAQYHAYDNTTSGLTADNVQDAIDEVLSTIPGAVDYGRVFYVSANVAIDHVGTIGDPGDPFGAEGFGALFDTGNDAVIFLPGDYTITQPILDTPAGGARYFYFMQGARITYTHPTSPFIQSVSLVIYFEGSVQLTYQSSGIVVNSNQCRIFEFDYLEITDATRISAGAFFSIHGRHLKVSTVGGFRIEGETHIDYVELAAAGTHIEINTQKKNLIHFGVVDAVDRGVEIKSSTTRADIKIGSITSEGFAIWGEGAFDGNNNIDIGNIYCDSTNTALYAVQNIPRGCKMKVNSVTCLNGVNGFKINSGASIEVNRLTMSGGGVGVSNEEASQYKWEFKCNYFEQNGNNDAIRLRIYIADNNILTRNMIDIKYCKNTVAGYHAIYMYTVGTSLQDPEIVIKGRYEAVEVPIRCQFTATLAELMNVMLDDVTLFSGDVSNCITGLNPNNKLRCKNVWANAPADANIMPVLEGINVSSEIVE